MKVESSLFSRNGTRIWHLRNSILASVEYRKSVSDMRDEIMTLDIYSDSAPRDKRRSEQSENRHWQQGTNARQRRLAADLTAPEDLTTNARRRELR
jgi:hypothetical protein